MANLGSPFIFFIAVPNCFVHLGLLLDSFSYLHAINSLRPINPHEEFATISSNNDKKAVIYYDSDSNLNCPADFSFNYPLLPSIFKTLVGVKYISTCCDIITISDELDNSNSVYMDIHYGEEAGCRLNQLPTKQRPG